MGEEGEEGAGGGTVYSRLFCSIPFVTHHIHSSHLFLHVFHFLPHIILLQNVNDTKEIPFKQEERENKEEPRTNKKRNRIVIEGKYECQEI